MKTFAPVLIPQLVTGALPWYYYNLRLRFAEQYDYRVSMRWVDLLALLVLAGCSWVVWRFARTIREHDASSYMLRVGLLSLLCADTFLSVVVAWGCIFVPYVPASFPIWTAGMALALTFEVAAPSITIVVSLSFVAMMGAALFCRPTPLARPLATA
jgi:hypothetical protein